MSEQEMLDYLISTGLYEITSKNSPYRSLYYEQRMIKTNKTIPIKELVKRFIEIDKEYNGETWNIKQILANIDIIIPVEDRYNFQSIWLLEVSYEFNDKRTV